MIILGIDPGSNITGFGIIEKISNKFKYITCGCIKVSGKEMPWRLQQIYQDIHSLMIQYRPDVVVVEQVFTYKNIASSLKLAQARGAALAAAASGTAAVAEYTPRAIKKTVVGYGGAEKSQMQHMVQLILNLTAKPAIDAADALAIAICHGQHLGILV